MGAYLSAPIVAKDTCSGHIPNRFTYGVSSHQGWRRTQEDSHVCQPLNDNEHYLFGVFDGHGGSEVAKFCAEYMPKELEQHEYFQDGKLVEALIAVFHRMDELMQSEQGRKYLESVRPKNDEDGAQEEALAILRKYMSIQDPPPNSNGNSNGDNGGNGNGAANKERSSQAAPSSTEEETQAGCTAVVALFAKNLIYVANAGDSRAVLSRNKKAIAISQDHKPSHVSERERIVAAGGFVCEMPGGISRVNGNLSLSRAIGDLRYKQNPDLDPAAQIITAEPDVHTVQLTGEEDFLVLACDGIWDVKDNQQVVDFVHERLKQGKDPTQVASELLDNCLAQDPKDSKGIGCDNMTCCIVLFTGNSSGSGRGDAKKKSQEQ